jgi:hypothetical protein
MNLSKVGISMVDLTLAVSFEDRLIDFIFKNYRRLAVRSVNRKGYRDNIT